MLLVWKIRSTSPAIMLALSCLILIQLPALYRCDKFVTKMLADGMTTVKGLVVNVPLSGQKPSLVKVNQFLGIRYAKAPVRFAKPKKYEPKTREEVDATKPPPACMQFQATEFEKKNKAAKMWLNNTEMSEDCLFLNVWQPQLSNSDQLPVMIWIYGGGFTLGTSTLQVYDGSILAAKEKVIVVSMQYRLGALGLLRLAPGNTKGDDTVALGNQAFYDMLLAIEWANDNIKQFNGNSKEMTIFGESAGAASASLLWMSPKANKYFKRAILQSGSLFARWSFSEQADAHDRGEKFAELCGCPLSKGREASVKCLQKLDAQMLTDLGYSVVIELGKERLKFAKAHESYMIDPEASATLYFDAPFKAVVDGDILQQSPEDFFKNAAGQNLPDLLIGVNSNEGIYFLLYGLGIPGASFLNENGDVELPDAVERAAKGTQLDLADLIALKILDKATLSSGRGVSSLPAMYYQIPTQRIPAETASYANPGQLTLNASQLMQRLDALTSDLDFICPTLEFADRVARHKGSNVYLYQFTRRTEATTMPWWLGVMHGYEIEYVFGMPRSKQFKKDFYTFTEDEQLLSDNVMKMWANFAKTGNPNDDKDQPSPDWPVYTPHYNGTYADDELSERYLQIGTPMTIGKGLHREQCNFWLQMNWLTKSFPAENVPDHATELRYSKVFILLACISTILLKFIL